MWKILFVLTFLVSSFAYANEVPLEQLAGLGWTMSPRSGSVSGGSPATIAVYAGCPVPPTASGSYSTSKAWYFDFGAGHTPAFYASNPPPAGHYAGDASFPYDNPNAISTPTTGWTTALAALAVWNHGGSIHSDFSATGTLTVTVTAATTIAFGATMLDTAGRRFIIANHTFAGAGSANLSLVAQAPGAASNDPSTMTFTEETGFSGAGAATATFALTGNMTGGSDFSVTDATHSRLWPGDTIILAGTTEFPKLTFGGSSNIPMVNLDSSGNPAFNWIMGDGVHTPHVEGITIAQAQYVVMYGEIDIDNTNPLSQYDSSTALSNGVTFSRVATNGDTFTVNGEVWTYTTGTPGAFQIAAGATATDTATNTATTLGAATSPGALGWNSYTHSGANVTLHETGFSTSGLPSFSTTIPQTNTEANIGIGQVVANSNTAAFKITGATVAEAYAVYAYDMNIDGAQNPGTPRLLDDYPMTGSLGISEVTGQVVPGNVGGPWNSVDWIYQTRPGVDVLGSTQNPIVNQVDPLGGAECITVQNTWIKYGTIALGAGSAKKTIFKDIVIDYAGSDANVNGNSNNTSWINDTVRNTVDNGSGAHPDGWQGQSTVNNFGGTGNTWPSVTGGWHDILIDRYSVYPAEDTTLSAATYHDFNGNSRPLAGEPTGIQGTITTYYNVTVTNSAIFSHNCPNLSFGQGYNLTFANNTVLWDGADPSNPNLFACNTSSGAITVAVSNASAGIPTPYNIVETNNVANLYNRGVLNGPCNLGITFNNDRLVNPYYQGADKSITFQGICPSSTSGTLVTQNPQITTSWESGGLISLPTTPLSTIFTSFTPAGFPANISTQFNVTLPVGSPLLGAGTTCCGATTTDFNGNPRPSPPSIGAFE